jgi:hypothetical protein
MVLVHRCHALSLLRLEAVDANKKAAGTGPAALVSRLLNYGL